jgi:hypothetical protein
MANRPPAVSSTRLHRFVRPTEMPADGLWTAPVERGCFLAGSTRSAPHNHELTRRRPAWSGGLGYDNVHHEWLGPSLTMTLWPAAARPIGRAPRHTASAPRPNAHADAGSFGRLPELWRRRFRFALRQDRLVAQLYHPVLVSL